MVKASVYTKNGSKGASDVALPKEVFEVEVKSHHLLQEAYRAYLAAGRSAQAKTKTRGMVIGSRRKHHRQKGTGAARAGTVQSPTRVGGGVAFGNTGEENYRIKLPLKAKRQAIRQALSLKASDGQVKVIEDIEVKESKTKEVATLLQKLGAGRKSLLVVKDKTAELVRATSNLRELELVAATYLNVFRILNADSIVITEPALESLRQWLSSKKVKE